MKNVNRKSNNVLVGAALVLLLSAAVSSAFVWGEVASAVKIGMLAFGFSIGVVIGILISRRSK